MKSIGCYIHIPFCESICSYCDFCKNFYNEKQVDAYLKELEIEIEDSYSKLPTDTLYIGGGTPSSLNIKQLEKLFEIINKKLDLSILKEFTIECNFENTTIEKINLFKKAGINRISFGLESINGDILKILERDANKENITKLINYCNKIGINNVNIDLMYAIPNETLKILEDDLDFILSLNINHISTYSLILEDHTKLKINNIKYIDEELDAKMYELICSKLENWDHYEISNFAKHKSYRSNHNLKYWHNEEYYGFGLGSSGYEGNIRYTKTKSLSKYLSGDYINKDSIEYLSPKDKIYYDIILNLRTKEGIDLEKFSKIYKKNLKDYYDYTDLVKNNLLIEKDNHLSIKEDLWYISNSIIIRFLEGEVTNE